MNPYINYFLYYCLLFCPILLNGQTSLQGIVTDQQGERLPFVNILINDSNKDGVSTDIDGRFSISQTTLITSLTFSYIGYEQLRLEGPFDMPLRVNLQSTAYTIDAIEVIAGENPAHRIIRKVIANRDLNNPQKLPAYECLTYNKLSMGFLPKTEEMDSVFIARDTSKKRIKKRYEALKKGHQNMTQTNMMLVESISKRKFQYPKDIQEEVLHNKVSGFQELPLATFATDVQPFSFYEDKLLLFEQAYLNPISKGSTKKYFFNIEDTLYQQQDTLFIISFIPKKGKNFEGLKGVLYIHTNQYAVQNVIAEPADKTLAKFKIEQKYAWVDSSHWFPEQLNFELNWDKFGYETYLSFHGKGKTYVKEVNLQPQFHKKTFKKGEHILFADDAHSTSDSTWSTQRVEPLNAKEIATYRVIDSLGQSLKLDKWLKRLTILGEGRYTIAGPIDGLLTNTIAFNNYEKFRLGLGLATNEKLSKNFELSGYYAYGFGDKAWKYGASLSIFFDAYEHNRIEIWHQNDIAVPAILDYQLSDNIFGARFFSNQIDLWNYTGATFYTRPIKYLSSSISIGQHEYIPTYDYSFAGQEGVSSQHYTELGLNFRYAYNETFSRFLGQSVFNNTNFPILELNYTKGFSGLWEGQHAYDKIVLALEHHFHTRLFGETHYRIEAGIINENVPFNRLFTGSSFGNTSVQLLSTSFRTMDNYEFLSDRFVHFYFRQDFGSLLLKTKKFQPEISLEHNIAFGSLSAPELHQGIEFNTLEKGFFEGGVVVNNILRLNYMNLGYLGLGLGVFYRYGPNALPTYKENRRIQVTTLLQF